MLSEPAVEFLEEQLSYFILYIVAIARYNILAPRKNQLRHTLNDFKADIFSSSQQPTVPHHIRSWNQPSNNIAKFDSSDLLTGTMYTADRGTM